LVVALIPVYGFAMLVDAIVFNSIEFWTGKNPVDMSYVPPSSRIVQNGKEKYMMSYNAKTGQVFVTSLAPGHNNHGVIFERTDHMVTAKNENGQVLYSSVRNDDGGVSIYDGNGKLVKNYPAGQIALLKEHYMAANN
jgi:flagellar hook assembly protein FlgD